MNEPQPVAPETEAQVTPVVEGESAQDLNSLLKEWEGDEQSPPVVEETPKDLSKDEISEIAKYVKDKRDAEIKEVTAKEYEAVVSSIKGDLPVNNKLIDGFLRVKASEDPRVLKAYQNRQKNPEAWSKVEKSMNREIKEMLGSLPDKGATETRKAVASAIINSKTSTPEPLKNLGQMSNAEFEKTKAEAFGIKD